MGGDVYWVRHGSGEAVPYCFTEFELEPVLADVAGVVVTHKAHCPCRHCGEGNAHEATHCAHCGCPMQEPI